MCLKMKNKDAIKSIIFGKNVFVLTLPENEHITVSFKKIKLIPLYYCELKIGEAYIRIDKYQNLKYK